MSHFIYLELIKTLVNLLANDRKGQAHKSTGQVLRVHLISYSFQVILLPRVLLNLTNIYHRRTHLFSTQKENNA